MSDKTEIQWTDSTWNPIRGCSRVSAGCDNCYAMATAHRFSGPGQPYDGLTRLRTVQGEERIDWAGHVATVPHKLDQPLRWKRPRRIFVNSMSDLFHPGVDWSYVNAVYGVMMAAHQHTFQVLTKRPLIAAEWWDEAVKCGAGLARSLLRQALNEDEFSVAIKRALENMDSGSVALPPQNVWAGVSIEDQITADERLRYMASLPGAVRFISAEPLLGPVVLPDDVPIDWVIVGGESGPRARTMDPAWALSLRDQCRERRIPFFFKQWGGVDKHATGRHLEGRTWDQFPGEPLEPTLRLVGGAP